jgi:hypothetical protein
MGHAARSLPPVAVDPAPRLRAVPPAPPAVRPRRPSPAVIRRRRAVALAGLAALAVLPLAALNLGGSPGGDAARIAALLRAGASDPMTLCAHLSPAMLAAAGGRAACVRSSPARGPDATVDGIRVHGATATAVVHRPDTDEVVRLVERDGAWLVDDVH